MYKPRIRKNVMQKSYPYCKRSIRTLIIMNRPRCIIYK